MSALRLMAGACVGMAALRVMACAYLSLLGDRSWFGAMALWLKMVALGAPLASTAGHAMRHEPCFFSSHPPFQGCAVGSWHSGVYGGTLLRGSGALGSYPPLWRRPPRMQAACTVGALLACSIPDPPPAARAHHCDRVAAGVRMLCIFTPLSRKRHL